MAGKLVGIRIDIESRSSTDIKKHGVYRYTEDPDFAVLIIAYSPIRQFPGGARKIGKPRAINFGDAHEVAQFKAILRNESLEKHAFNAAFERVCLSRWLGMGNSNYMDPRNWRCSAILANANGVFGSLDDVARAVRSPIKKDAEGKALIRLFSIPDRKAERFHLASATCWCGADHRAQAARYKSYCCQDVLTEAAVAGQFPALSAEVQAQYEADQRINDRGFRHFKVLSQKAVEQVAVEKDRVMGELKVLTGLGNPNSGPQFKGWLESQGYRMVSLDKDHRAEALADPFVPQLVRQALVLKGQASLTSVTKHQAAINTRCADGRIRGSLQFYGAHTGREAGRGIQPQNLPRAEASATDRWRLIKGTAGTDAPEIAKGTARSSIVPARGCVFVAADYNAIEARVLAGLAGEMDVINEFKGEGKFYELTASTMFKADKAGLVAALVACGKCGQCSACALRGKAKVAALALGFAGGAGALVVMGAAKEGIDVGNYPELNAEWKALGMPGKFFNYEKDRQDWPELERLKFLYRDASPATVRFWKLCARAFDIASSGKGARFGTDQSIAFIRDGRHNRMVLPSGRSIWYRNAKSWADPERPDRIDRRTFVGKGTGVGHMTTDTHGGKITENCVQAVARDILFDLIMRIEAAGLPAKLVLHVHDEVVLEMQEKYADQVKADVIGMMADSPAWASFIPLRGEGKVMERYAK